MAVKGTQCPMKEMKWEVLNGLGTQDSDKDPHHHWSSSYITTNHWSFDKLQRAPPNLSTSKIHERVALELVLQLHPIAAYPPLQMIVGDEFAISRVNGPPWSQSSAGAPIQKKNVAPLPRPSHSSSPRVELSDADEDHPACESNKPSIGHNRARSCNAGTLSEKMTLHSVW